MSPPFGGAETVTAPEGTVTLAPGAVAPPDTAEATAESTGSASQTASTSVKTPETAILEVPAGSEFSRPKSDEEAQVPAAEASPGLAKAPAAAPPAEEPSLPLADRATAPPPSGQSEAPATMPEPAAEPGTAPNAATAEVATDAPLAKVSGAGQGAGLPPAQSLPSPGADAAPMPAPDSAPKPASTPVIDTAPATDANPAPEPTTQAPKPAVTAPAPAPETMSPAPETPAPETPAPETPAPETPAPEAPAPAPADDVASEAAEDAPTMDESVPDESMFEDSAPDEAAPDENVPDEIVPDESAPDEGAVAAGAPKFLKVSPKAPQGDTGLSQPGLPQPGLKRLVPGVKVNHLPSISTETVPAALLDDTASLPADAAPAAEGKPAGALTLYAAKFANPDNKPVLAILLLDIGVGAGGLDANALAALPFAATIAIDPQRKDAAVDAAAYRAAGSEVAILAGDLPQGATPADLEVAYQSYVQALPDAVAFTGTPTAEFQSNRLTAQHIAQLLAGDGRGFLTYEQGLNPGRQAAEKAGTAYAPIEKLFGQAEDNSGTLGRELDRAAFDAGQRGVRVIALPTTPEAITGLMAWAASPAAAAVAIAPVSAVMLGSVGN